ncbi:uncharacterized protein METZ01_LOCUS116107, partial [marine metagenome]
SSPFSVPFSSQSLPFSVSSLFFWVVKLSLHSVLKVRNPESSLFVI